MVAEVVSINQSRVSAITAKLAKADKGQAYGSVSNLIIILAEDPQLEGMLGFNEFTSAPVLRKAPPIPLDGAEAMPGPYPRSWQGTDVSLVQSYLQRAWTHAAGREDTEAAMGAVAALHRFHPPRDWLNSLSWDGRPRLDSWMIHTYGAADTPYHRAVAAKFLIAAVRRVRQPGCKHDAMPVLEGLQDLGKSSSISRLFGTDWFTDSLPVALEGKDAAIALQGVWVIEFSEVEQLIRAEVETIKSFLSRQVDRYRPPYGRHIVEVPRQCVFVGTTNSDDYLRDVTGNRRFWPIRCHKVDLEWLTLARTQLWAEAAAREAQGEVHWLDDGDVKATAQAVQGERMQEDVWTDQVLGYVEYLSRFTTAQILTDCLKIPVERQTRREQIRVAAIVKAAGYEVKVDKDADRRSVKRWGRA